MAEREMIRIRGAGEHNLKGIDIDLPRDAMIVITGLSGSGKSSLAFDTIYAEGQRRYMESLSSYARQYLDQLPRPTVESVDGLSPAISIEQKTVSRNPRSTVGTVTEVHDYLRVLYANIGHPHCPSCGAAIEAQTPDKIVDSILAYPAGSKLLLSAPIVRGRKGEYRQEMADALRLGYTRARVDGELVNLDEDIPKLKKSYKHDISIVIDRIVVREDMLPRVRKAVDTALKMADGLVEVQRAESDQIQLFSRKFACTACGGSIEEITHRVFSFNSPQGACPTCEGIGHLMEVVEDLVVPDRTISIKDGALAPWSEVFSNQNVKDPTVWYTEIMKRLVAKYSIDVNAPWNKLPKSVRDVLLHGSDEPFEAVYTSAAGQKRSRTMTWEGMIPRVRRRYEDGEESFSRFMQEVPCKTCNGSRLKPTGLAVKIGGLNIAELGRLDIERALEFLNRLKITAREEAVGGLLLKEVRDRLGFLNQVGLGYLTLDRRAGTLSGGEGQRIRLATQIGSQLTGVLYVLDEPSIGLHPSDNDRLLESLRSLRDLGNTLVVVEHDEATMRAADWLVDLGPGAGRLGGHIVASGIPSDVIHKSDGMTAKYLRNEVAIPVPEVRRPYNADRKLTVVGASENNLKNLTVSFPLGLLTVVTGVSGSGKSTLVNDILFASLFRTVYRQPMVTGAHTRIDGLDLIDKVVDVDQSPIGRTPRSNPVTYIGVFTAIRDLFASLPESQVRGYGPGRFSFNTAGGRCDACGGDGSTKVEMHFLPDVYVECQSCRGKRYNRETLEVRYAGRTVADVLAMTVDDAVEFFATHRQISHKLKVLQDVGLGYITLGQSATTLSGGEAQRIKLSKELSKRGTGRTVYILDEPTTGLHFEDIRHLLALLNGLVDQGNTVIVIEHNLDVIKAADWVIDLGPGGGLHGGEIVAEGTPETVATAKRSLTGKHIAAALGLAKSGPSKTESTPAPKRGRKAKAS